MHRSSLMALCSAHAAVVVALLLIAPAFAADGAVTAGSLFADVRGILEAVLGVVAAAIVGLLAWGARQAFGVTVDEKMRTALQSAITGGIHLGLDAVQGLANRSTFAVRSEVLSTAMGYVQRYAPDALSHFGLGEREIEELVRAQLAKVMPDGVLLGAVVTARTSGAAGVAGA